MNRMNGNEFNWDELLDRIESKKIIPVIGHGLYWIEKEGKGKVLLYDFLADKVAQEIGMSSPSDVSHKFSKVAFEFLRKNRNNYLRLSKLLINIVKEEKLIAASPLWKLARIKAFKLFINTAYDDFLENTIKTVRDFPTKVLCYTLKEKKLSKLDRELFESMKESECTLVYNIYGNFGKYLNIDPAYTEKDILETIVELQKDMKSHPENNLFQELESNSLLFMGCGYDDWLFRFFVRTIANEPFQIPKDPNKFIFIGDIFGSQKEPLNELPRFLKNYESEIFYSCDGKDFVDTLFKKLDKDVPDEIIPVTDFPGTTFISFHGANRSAAVRLASNLREDGIDVWLDEKEFEPGDEVDDTIIKAIKKCAVFIPLVSRETKNIQVDNGKLKYHCREWEWAYSNMKSGNNPKTIIPVKIDNIDWIYDKFEGLYFISVTGGNRVEGYEELKDKLLKLQKQIYE